jgi:hypothetical protein
VEVLIANEQQPQELISYCRDPRLFDECDSRNVWLCCRVVIQFRVGASGELIRWHTKLVPFALSGEFATFARNTIHQLFEGRRMVMSLSTYVCELTTLREVQVLPPNPCRDHNPGSFFPVFLLLWHATRKLHDGGSQDATALFAFQT